LGYGPPASCTCEPLGLFLGPSSSQHLVWIQISKHAIFLGGSPEQNLSEAASLFRHSPLGGSDDLERWGRAAAEAVAGAYRERVLAPLLQLKDELFRTFRQRRSIVSVAEYENDRASLERMLRAFEADFAGKVCVLPIQLFL
jgi:hypothetical protein